MHGRMWLESAPGKGSTFNFTARFALADRVAAAAPLRSGAPAVAGPAREPARTAKLAVLLVEDNSVNRRLAQIVVARRGHTVTAVDSGAAALGALRQGRFDLILMDVQMPGMDGIETTRAIRRSEERLGRRVPIIALTAHAMAEDRERCLGAGMDGYLVKPIQPAALLDAIERIAVEPEPPAGAADWEAVAADGAELLEQVGGDARLLGEIADLFVRESGKHLAALRQAIGSRDAEAFGREIHTLRGLPRGLPPGAAEEAREFFEAVADSASRYQRSCILISVHSSMAVFTVERSGFLTRFTSVGDDPAHKIALIADNRELDHSHEYLALLGRLHGINVRHFRDEPSALEWLKHGPEIESDARCSHG